MSSPHRQHWQLDATIDFLNHGSFGACPLPVLESQDRWRRRMENEPVRFLAGELEDHMTAARQALGGFLGADGDDLALLANASSGINTVVRSLPFSPGDEILITDHEYGATANAARFAAARAGATVAVAALPFPIGGPAEASAAILAAVTTRTRLVIIDHVTSQTGLILPVETLVAELTRCGIDTLVDGAHAPGMLPLDLDQLGAAYYAGNCHKWLCAPKGAGFLHVRRARQERIRPLTISHGAGLRFSDRSRFRLEFDWTGTTDPTPHLVLADCIAFLGGLHAGGWPALMEANHAMVLEARRVICEALNIQVPAPDSMLGSLAAVPIADGTSEPPTSALYQDPLQARLLQEHRIQVPVIPWPAPPRRLLRLSAQAYNDSTQYRRLAAVLPGLLA